MTQADDPNAKKAERLPAVKPANDDQARQGNPTPRPVPPGIQAPPATPASYEEASAYTTYRANMAVLAEELAGVVRAIGDASPSEATTNALSSLRATSERLTRMANEGEAARTNLRNH